MHRCEWSNCQFITDSLKTLYSHCISHKCGDFAYCQWRTCGVKCHKRARLNAHLLTHVPYRAFSCKICSRAFKREQEMKRHFASVHLGDQFGLEAICKNNESKITNKMAINALIN